MSDPFRTVLPASRGPFEIDRSDRLLLVGSCFTEHFGERLGKARFHRLVNPFGIVYNPASMAHCLDRLFGGEAVFADADLFENQGLWHSWEHHGRFSHPDRPTALAAINAAYTEAAAFLSKTNRLLITLGTAEVFIHRDSGRVVANNHKMPASQFDARRLEVVEVVEMLRRSIDLVQGRQPDLKVVLTVSPVRHTRLGAVENQRSKAVLVLACAELERLSPGVFYFPAYELLLDDLRDYRFYAADMIHPGEAAIQYIWEYFSYMFFSAKTRELNARLEKLGAALGHRPFHAGSAQHRVFVEGQLAVIQRLEEEHPELDFSREKAYFEGL